MKCERCNNEIYPGTLVDHYPGDRDCIIASLRDENERLKNGLMEISHKAVSSRAKDYFALPDLARKILGNEPSSHAEDLIAAHCKVKDELRAGLELERKENAKIGSSLYVASMQIDKYITALKDAMDQATILGCSDAHYPEEWEMCHGCKMRRIIAAALNEASK